MKIKVIILILFFLVGCKEPNPNEKKIIDTDGFEIEVPANWRYKKEKGIDSFAGRIKNKEVDLSFDWSEMGYANHLIADEKEYLIERKWEWMPMNLPYAREGVNYTSGDVQSEKEKIMKEKGISDTSIVKVEKIQIPKEEILFEENKYKAILTYKDTIVKVDIEMPEEIKEYQIQIDTIGNYRRKLIRPKNEKKGITGVYFKDLRSNFNFNLFGRNLSLENQEKAIQAFKTIKIKRK